jgi:hypothetical protein
MGTAIAILSLTPSFAADSTDSGSAILNGQVNMSNVTSTVTATIDRIGGSVDVQSAAIGNMLDITTMNDTRVNSNQYVQAGEIGSYAGVAATNVRGDVSVSNQAVCNAASVSTDPAITAVTNLQQCNADDPSAVAYVDAINIGGSVSIANSAIGNSFEADTNAANMPINNTQVNTSPTVATTTANIKNVAGSVSVSASAIGNTAQVVHYSTD